jgi:hypothetical protein
LRQGVPVLRFLYLGVVSRGITHQKHTATALLVDHIRLGQVGIGHVAYLPCWFKYWSLNRCLLPFGKLKPLCNYWSTQDNPPFQLHFYRASCRSCLCKSSEFCVRNCYAPGTTHKWPFMSLPIAFVVYMHCTNTSCTQGSHYGCQILSYPNCFL